LDRARALLDRAARNGYAPARAKLLAMGGTVSNAPIPNDAPKAVQTRMAPGDPMNVDIARAMPPADLTPMNAGFDAYAANDKARAFGLWRTVAERGNPEAQLRVGLMYARGEGTTQDMIEAYRWLKLSANQGQPKAVVELAIVSKALAPSERAIAESLVKSPQNKSKNAL
jgi:TPR repeat protein